MTVFPASHPASPAAASLLIVDDSPDDIALLVEFLRQSSLRLAVAMDGQEGYQKAVVLQPDLVLLDVRMPRTDGFAACRLLKADPRTRDIPVIFLSGANELEDRLQGLRLGAVDYISKPFAAEEVQARINVHVALSRRRPAAAALTVSGHEAPDADAAGSNSCVAAAMQEMRRDIRLTPSLPDLARQVGTNEKRLSELFRDATGLTAIAWLREERFQVACRLLVETDLEIQQVADHVGYGSAGNFTTMFRERLGVTPRDYRLVQRERQP